MTKPHGTLGTFVVGLTGHTGFPWNICHQFEMLLLDRLLLVCLPPCATSPRTFPFVDEQMLRSSRRCNRQDNNKKKMLFDLLILIGRFSMVGTSLLNAKWRLLCLLAKASDFFVHELSKNQRLQQKQALDHLFHSFDCDGRIGSCGESSCY